MLRDAALEGALHHAGKQMDGVGQGAAVDVVVDCDHGAWPASASRVVMRANSSHKLQLHTAKSGCRLRTYLY
jgi:hypothetical protein